MNLLKKIKRFNQKVCYGCSYTPDFNFSDCCIEHDKAYEKGGRKWDRYIADLQLQECIKEHGHPYKAKIYYLGVRLFGRFFFNKR